MKRLLVLFLILISIKIQAEDFTVLAINGINLRKNPKKNGSIIKALPFGTVVEKVDYSSFFPDTINQVIGNWIKVTFQTDTGYVFSPYIYSQIKVNLLENENEILMLKEGLPGYNLNYDPRLNYYGFYKDSDNFYIEKIKVSIILSKIDGMSHFSGLDCLEDFPNILVKTNKSKTSIFIFGVKDSLCTGMVNTSFYCEKLGYDNECGFLAPEKEIMIGKFNKEFFIRAYDSVSVENNNSSEKKYQLEFYYNDLDQKSLKQKICSQNLSSSLNLYGSGEKHNQYKTPKVQWAGDLNSDGLIDFIIYQHTMTDSGGVAWTNTLFQSKSSSEKIYLRKAAEVEKGSCH